MRSNEIRVLLIAETTTNAAAEWARREGVSGLLVDEKGAVANSYVAAGVTPFATAIVRGRVLGSGVVNRWDEVLALLRYGKEHVHSHLPSRAEERTHGAETEEVPA